MKPNLFIVGHPKTGSTALHAFLAEHPQIFMSQHKEPWFFCTDFHQESDAYHRRRLFFPYRDIPTYEKLFSKATNQTILGEASAVYLYSTTAAEQIKGFNPNSRIIVLLREPLSFLESLHKEFVRNAMEDESNFTSALAIEPQRRKGASLPKRVPCPSWTLYTNWIRFSEQIARYHNAFDPSQIKIIVSEDFKRDNARVYRDVLGFLGLDTDFDANYRALNDRGRVRVTSLGQVVFHPRFRSLAFKILPYWAYRQGIGLTRKLFWREDSETRALDPSVRRKLKEKFAREVFKLDEFLGSKIADTWGYRDTVETETSSYETST